MSVIGVAIGGTFSKKKKKKGGDKYCVHRKVFAQSGSIYRLIVRMSETRL